MSVQVTDDKGVVRQRWDDAARTYTEWDADGAVVSTRAFTAEENARADAVAAEDAATTNRGAVETKLSQAMADLQALIDTTNATINGSPAAAIKALARVVRLLVRAALRQYDGTT